MKYWGKIKTEDIMQNNVIAESKNLAEAVMAICDSLDLSKPIICDKHRIEIRDFRRTVFYADDFIDSVNFDVLEIEIIDPRKKRNN